VGCNNKLYYIAIFGLTVLLKVILKRQIGAFGLAPFYVARLSIGVEIRESHWTTHANSFIVTI
jgi:hypothetical protein